MASNKVFFKKKAKSGSILLSKKNSPFPISMTRSSFLFFLFFLVPLQVAGAVVVGPGAIIAGKGVSFSFFKNLIR